MTTWRHYARTWFPRVEKELGLPAASSRRDLTRCPLHGDVVGPVSHLCKTCFDTAWAEVGRRYASRAQGLRGNTTTERRTP